MTDLQNKIIFGLFRNEGRCVTFAKYFDRQGKEANNLCESVCPLRNGSHNFECYIQKAFKLSKIFIKQIPKEDMLELLVEEYNETDRQL